MAVATKNNVPTASIASILGLSTGSILGINGQNLSAGGGGFGSPLASDDFNRTSLGSNWEQLNPDWGNMTIDSVSGQVYGASANGESLRMAARWVGAGGITGNQWAKAQIGTLSHLNGDYAIGVICRASGSNATRSYYFLVVHHDSSGPTYTTVLGKIVAGTLTVIHSSSVAWSVADEFGLLCNNTTIVGLKNGVSIGASYSVTDSSIGSGLPGITGSGGSTVRLDNWTAGNYT